MIEDRRMDLDIALVADWILKRDLPIENSDDAPMPANLV